MQVAKRASVLKRKRSKSKMDTPGASSTATNNNRDCPQAQTLPPPPNPRRDSDGEVVFYIEEPKASTSVSSVHVATLRPLNYIFFSKKIRLYSGEERGRSQLKLLSSEYDCYNIVPNYYHYYRCYYYYCY